MNYPNNKDLQTLSREVRRLETKLRISLGNVNPNIPKWQWPKAALETVRELQNLAASGWYDRVSQELNDLLEWPAKQWADPELFIGGKRGFETFNRGKDWFSEMKFNRVQTIYTFSNRWDHAKIRATFLVPKDLDKKREVGFMFFFHGGGYVREHILRVHGSSLLKLVHRSRRFHSLVLQDKS